MPPKFNFPDPILQRVFEDVYDKLGEANVDVEQLRDETESKVNDIIGGLNKTPTSGTELAGGAKMLPVPAGLTVLKISFFGVARVEDYSLGQYPAFTGFEFFGTQELEADLPTIPQTKEYRIGKGLFPWCVFFCDWLSKAPYRVICRTSSIDGFSSPCPEADSDDLPNPPVITSVEFTVQPNGELVHEVFGIPACDCIITWEDRPAEEFVAGYEMRITEESTPVLEMNEEG